MDRQKVILLCGAPGTGKSTLRRLAPAYFRPHYGETATLETDDFYMCFDPDWSVLEPHRWSFAYDTCLHTAQWLLHHHLPLIVISGNVLYTRDNVNRALNILYPYSSVFHITLDAPHAILVERVRQRGDLHIHPPERLARWRTDIQHQHAPWSTIIDTSTKTPHELLHVIDAYCQTSEHALGQQV